MPASVLKLTYFPICTIHESTHLTSQEKEVAGRTPWLWGPKLWLPFREMHRATPKGEDRETSNVFFTCSQNTCSRQMEREGPENSHPSTLKVEQWPWQVTGAIIFHVIWGSLINITFYLGGKIAHIILSLVQVQEVQGENIISDPSSVVLTPVLYILYACSQ